MNKIFSIIAVLSAFAVMHVSHASPVPLWYPAGYYRASVWVKKPVLKYYFFAIKIEVDGTIGGKGYVRTYSGLVSHARNYRIRGKFARRPSFRGLGAISRAKIRFGDGTRVSGLLSSAEPSFDWLHEYIPSPDDIASTKTTFRIRFAAPQARTASGKIYGYGSIVNPFTGIEFLLPDSHYNPNYGF